ncbi:MULTISPECIES: hemolysin family protein [Jonquetella]|uniref:CBS domain-containing protein n=1 Tax=Jonquetella anthropi DSM 22815 TaxID=885272 RepID=H0UK03_9BACT|nr:MULTISPECIES: hemolysin family protein [Jonquetella]EEX48572.1 hypothetical protein GCWU000246_00818 [Jonquetella anthropi E3_33 E1]EHM13013.1 CBS domain-containing protein [Jonquetella anthropi DSM 22815]ERL23798.1 membrane protein, PF01595 family [Jonquetella sp. BV3C21]
MLFSMLVLVVCLILLSAFFSAADMAYSSLNKVRLRRFVDEGTPGASRTMELVKDFSRTISVILIGGNVVDILNTAVVTAALASVFGPVGALYSTAIMTVLIIIFCEILPKAFVKDHAETFALRASPAIRLLSVLFKPFTWVTQSITEQLRGLSSSKAASPSVTHDELLSIVDDMAKENTLPRVERELIENAINFNELKVWEVQTPRVDLFALDVDESSELALSLILKNHYTRIPVYEGTTDNIIGVLNEKIVLEKVVAGEPLNLRACMAKPLLVSGETSLLDAFRILKTNRTHMAVVLDDYGGTSGIITLEDLMEELLGEIYDELDDIKEYVTQIDGNAWLAVGDIYIEDLFFKFLGTMEIPDTESPTLNGWMLEEFKVFPELGASIQWGPYSFEVVKTAGQRISRVRITKVSGAASQSAPVGS